MSGKVELKPCPWCGSRPHYFQWASDIGASRRHSISCENGSVCAVIPEVSESSEDDAVAAWNTRSADAQSVAGGGVPSLDWLEANHAAWVASTCDTPYLEWLRNSMLATQHGDNT